MSSSRSTKEIDPDIIAIVRDERRYQAKIYPSAETAGEVLQELPLLNEYVVRLNVAYKNESVVEDLDVGLNTLDVLRKIAAIAIRGLENGAAGGYIVPRAQKGMQPFAL